MSAAQADYFRPVPASGIDLRMVIPPLLVIAAVLFNFGLCFVNTNITTITAGPIIAVEMLIIGCTLIYSFHRLTAANVYWLYIIAALSLIVALVSMMQGYIVMKPMRDVLIVPAFVALGLTTRKINYTPIILCLSGFVTIIALLEAFDADQFLNIFNFKSYFVSKGAMEDLKWLPMNTFASGMRPGGRFLFDIPGIHRISSVFLEPVSLGFYAFISGLYFVAMKNRISKTALIIGLTLSFVLIWLSDGRMALSCLFYSLIFRWVFVHIHHRFNVLIFPLMFIMAYIIDINGLMDITGEGVGARFHSTFQSLSNMNIDVLLGNSKDFPIFTADSGIAYIVTNLGIWGALLYWLSPIFYARKMTPEARVFLAGLAFYISFGFLISAAIYSIKSASLLWCLLGYFVIKNFDHDEEYSRDRA